MKDPSETDQMFDERQHFENSFLQECWRTGLLQNIGPNAGPCGDICQRVGLTLMKQWIFTFLFALVVVVMWRLVISSDNVAIAPTAEALQAFLVPAIFLFVVLGLVLVGIVVRAPHLATPRRIHLFTLVSSVGLAAAFLAAVAYTKLAP